MYINTESLCCTTETNNFLKGIGGLDYYLRTQVFFKSPPSQIYLPISM